MDRKLYRLNLPADGRAPVKTDVQVYSLPSLRNATGDARPFAVHYHEGKVYVGLVWDATTSNKASDLKGSVLMMDPSADHPQFSEVFSTPLNYSRGILDYGVAGWRPWIDDYTQAVVPNAPNWLIYPQPILADIEFDTDGSMMLGFMDRLGHQTGDGQQFRPTGSPQLQLYRGLSGGDVLRVARSRQHFELEQNARLSGEGLPTLRSAGQNNGEGPGGGEFYVDDSFTANGITWHHETAMGGLALLPESNELLVASREPVAGQYLTGGVKWFSNQTGQMTGSRAMFPTGAAPGYYWKTNSVGDITLIPATTPIELSARIWHDRNENGFQDAGEPGLAGLTVQLFQYGKAVATTQTDANGRYRFCDSTVTGGLLPKTAYQIRIPLEPTHSGLYVPLRRQGTPGFTTDLPALVDNDAVSEGDMAVIRLTTPAAGESLHGLDAGLRIPAETSTETSRKLTLTPNPASSQTELVYQSPQAEGTVTISLRDTGGRLLQTLSGTIQQGTCRQLISLGQLLGGTYFVTVTEGSIPTTRSLLKH